MNHVRGIEQLGDSGVDVLPSLFQCILAGGGLGVVNKVKLEILSTVWSVVGKIGISAIPIFMGEDVVTPGNSGVANRRTVPKTFIVRVWVIGDGQGMPAQRTCELIAVLRLDGAVSLARIVDTPLEDVVGRGTFVFPGNRSVGIGSPVDDGDDLVRRVGRDSSLIPVILHLDLELPN